MALADNEVGAMIDESVKLLGPAYLRRQADRCQHLSAECMALGTARDLRLMSDEYLTEASKLDDVQLSLQRGDARSP
jgi:hypothetical protein